MLPAWGPEPNPSFPAPVAFAMGNETIAERLRQMQPGGARATVFAGGLAQAPAAKIGAAWVERRSRAAQVAGEAMGRVLPTLAKAASISPAYSFGVVACLPADGPEDPAARHIAASLTAPAADLEVLYVLRGRVLTTSGERLGYLDFEDTRRVGDGWQIHISDPWAYGWFGSSAAVDSWIYDLLVLARWFQAKNRIANELPRGA